MARLRRGTYSVEGRGWQVSNPVLDTRSDSECNVVTFIGETRVSVISLDMKAGNLYFNGKQVYVKEDPALQKLLGDGLEAIRQAAAAQIRDQREAIEQVKRDLS